MRSLPRWIILLLPLLVTACSSSSTTSSSLSPVFTGVPRAATLTSQPLKPASACTNTFVTHTLPHTTTVQGERIHLFDSNGSGVAVGDLDGDGDEDLAFANLDAPNQILWNEGGLQFRPQRLDDSSSRGVAIVDVDGDGLLDITFTHRAAGVSFWRNRGAGNFVRQPLNGVNAPAYAFAWGDLNGDTRLDLVTGSYNAELDQVSRSAFLFSSGAGVYVYEQQADAFVGQRIAPSSQALVIALYDLNRDSAPDIWVGNDFETRDQLWLRAGSAWAPALPFDATTESTMSIAQGDIDNDGSPELFATDMKPYDIATTTLASWLPVMARMPQQHAPDDPQVMENVLLVPSAANRYVNQAYEHGVDATGWSWSANFGDLDADGFLDLYIVNGMIAAELFPHLPNAELVEANQALRNDGTGHFTPMPAWGLGSTLSGRGMSMADMDGDGDLDIVVNNLRDSAQLFENRLCGGQGVTLDLHWKPSANTRAVGARVALQTSVGTFYRDVQATQGYLSGSSPRLHIGMPAGAILQAIEVRWPDGAVSRIEQSIEPAHLTISREE